MAKVWSGFKADIRPKKSIELLAHSLPAGQTWVEYIASDPTPCFLQLGIENWREAITVTDTAYWTTSECEREPNSLCELYSYAKGASRYDVRKIFRYFDPLLVRIWI